MIEKNMLGTAGLVGSIADRIRGIRDERSVETRVGYALETAGNKARKDLETAGVIGGTALAVDTFAGDKKALSFIKSKLKVVGSKFSEFKTNFKFDKVGDINVQAEKILNGLKDKLPKNIKGAKLEDIMNSIKNNLKDGVKGQKFDDVIKAASEKTVGVKNKLVALLKKLPDKIKLSPEITTKAKSVISYLKNNKKTAIIAAGAALLAGVFTKFSHKQGKIDQEYEDKARIEKAMDMNTFL